MLETSMHAFTALKPPGGSANLVTASSRSSHAHTALLRSTTCVSCQYRSPKCQMLPAACGMSASNQQLSALVSL